MTLLLSTKLLCAKGLLGSVLLPHHLLNVNLQRPLETQLRAHSQWETTLAQSQSLNHTPLDTHMAWDTPKGLGPVTDSAISCQVEGPKHLAQQIGGTQRGCSCSKGGAAPCQGVAPFEENSFFSLSPGWAQREFSLPGRGPCGLGAGGLDRQMWVSHRQGT